MNWTTLPRSKLTEHDSGWRGGVGPELLLIHGVGMQADFWSNIVAALRSQFSLTVVDMPGHGDSEVLQERNSDLQHYTDRIANIVAATSQRTFVAGIPWVR